MPIKELNLQLSARLKNVKLKARMDILNKALEGNWNTLFKGQGMEFAGFRQYSFSDDASKIDWGASLRAHQTLVRELEEYHNFNVFFLLDVSDSMLCSSTGKLKAEYGAELCYALCHSLINTGDAIGLGMFSDKLITKISPSLGKGVFYKIIKELENPANYGGQYDLTKVLKYVQSFLGDRSIIIIISDFIGLKDGWHKYLNIVSGKYDLIGIRIVDPRDIEMPDTGGQYLLEDPYTGAKIYIDSHQYAKKYEEDNKQYEEFIRNSFEKSKLGYVSLRTDEEFQDKILNYFRKRLSLVK